MIEIIKKAWVINPSNLEEPWSYDTDDVYYGTRGSAKCAALIRNDAGRLMNGDDLSFLNIRVSRSKHYDIVKYNGKEIRRHQIANETRKDKIADLDQSKMYYVQDQRRYVGNAVLWWGLNGSGYVTDLSNAHKYTHKEIQNFDPRETDIIWESEHVETAIRQYVDMQGLDRNSSI